MTREKLIPRERHQKSLIYEYITYIFRIGIPTERKNTNSQQNHMVFLAATDSENKTIQMDK